MTSISSSDNKMTLADLADITVPKTITAWPTMMTPDEQELLFRLTAKHYKGVGIIVDAGIFLGASTHALASGLAVNPIDLPKFPVIQSYDMAIWVSSMDRYMDVPEVMTALGGKRLSDGDSFADLLKDLLSPHADYINLSIGDICQTAHTDKPVEIAFYDCLKAADRDWATFKAFAPQYIPDHTVILQQDYFYEGAADHKLRQELYADYYRCLGRAGSTAVFMLEKALPSEAFLRDAILDLPVKERVRLLRQAAARADHPKEKLLVELSLLEHLIEIGAKETATEICNELRQSISAADTSEVTRRPENVFKRLEGQLASMD